MSNSRPELTRRLCIKRVYNKQKNVFHSDSRVVVNVGLGVESAWANQRR
jgi:hypothetical protein